MVEKNGQGINPSGVGTLSTFSLIEWMGQNEAARLFVYHYGPIPSVKPSNSGGLTKKPQTAAKASRFGENESLTLGVDPIFTKPLLIEGCPYEFKLRVDSYGLNISPHPLLPFAVSPPGKHENIYPTVIDSLLKTSRGERKEKTQCSL